MAFSDANYGSDTYAPSAPSLPDSYGHQEPEVTVSDNDPPPPPTANTYYYGKPHSQYGRSYVRSYGHSYARSDGLPELDLSPSSYDQPSSSSSYDQETGGDFPPGTDPDVISSFQMVDKDGSGFIDDNELQQALSSAYQMFSLRTIRLLMFLFKNINNHDILKLGPQEFAALWSCLGEWRTMFQKYDTDKSGKIDVIELRDALFGLGLAVPPTVLQLLTSRYEDGSGHRAELNFDSFVECGMIVKGLTEKFKEKDRKYTGSATFSYNAFMSIVIPFLVSYN
ncbi:PREDICTED: probable calcium-binding protein CML48 [Fragaria vesca subsp. vesca]|uniref:probable calcium-binding protein CML48 n=1 Tax=Fragaria vesca subsp. vesca TaxID=101020 RepID=UPI0002C362D8|nr:PREDICTED: probable calcium-binding protein CML48 [Fragaria vesca subsp. vesca]